MIIAGVQAVVSAPPALGVITLWSTLAFMPKDTCSILPCSRSSRRPAIRPSALTAASIPPSIESGSWSRRVWTPSSPPMRSIDSWKLWCAPWRE